MGCTDLNSRVNLSPIIHNSSKYSHEGRSGLNRFSLISKKEMAKEQTILLESSEEILKYRLPKELSNGTEGRMDNKETIKQIGFRNDFELSRFGKVSDFRKSDFRVPRAGIIFYTFVDDQLYCCFGKDRKTQDLTDFGGGRKRKESSIQCALREGGEESRFVFGKIFPEEIDNYRCLYSTRMLIIFIPVEAPPQLDSNSLQPEWLDSKNRVDIRKITVDNFANKTFLEKDQERDSCFNELSSLVWVNEAELIDLFSSRPSRRIFSMVRKFICSSQLFQPGRINIFKNSLKELFAHSENTESILTEKEYVSPIISLIDSPSNSRTDYPAWSPFDTPELVTLN